MRQRNSECSEEKRHRGEIYRILRCNFVFIATPEGGTAIGDQIPGGDPAAPELQVPDAIDAPTMFTPGDRIGLPSKAVRIGEKWKTPVNSSGITGDIAVINTGWDAVPTNYSKATSYPEK